MENEEDGQYSEDQYSEEQNSEEQHDDDNDDCLDINEVIHTQTPEEDEEDLKTLSKSKNAPKMTWDASYKKLVEFHTVHGHCKVSRKYDKRLNNWLSGQKERRKSGKMAQKRIEQLDALGFDWELKRPTTPWETTYERLKEYHRVHGHTNVPFTKDKFLHRWVQNQRSRRRDKKLRKDREDLLDELGFQWTVVERAKQVVPWEDSFFKLKYFLEISGLSDVPRTEPFLFWMAPLAKEALFRWQTR
eukprot:TRINITY_DN10584_c0_g1_i1.p1 TRINITY_DN10584_c0_g1~~TRINITY_DN10584_c0_g1_i1.p1  ORF type:complete len:252 (-),score=57.31 TRINITY_DN10584_c0_g1_i1:197-931(-)